MSFLRMLQQRLPAPVRRIAGKVLALGRGGAHALARPYLQMRRESRRAQVRLTEAARKPVALFLAPEAAVRSYLAAHAIVARTIAGQGITPVFLSCDGLLPTCSAKEVFGQPPTAPGAGTAVCRMCRQSALSVGNSYDLNDIAIETVLTDQDRERAAAIAAQPFDTLLALEYDGVAFGTFALGDTLRRRRLTDASEFGDGDRALFRALLHSALLIYFSVQALSDRFDLRRIAFFGDYAYWLPVQVFAARHGIGLAGFDYGYNVDIDHRFIGIRPLSANAQTLQKVENWPTYRDRSLPPGIAKEILSGGLKRLGFHGGRTTFSPNWTHRKQPIQTDLGLSLSRKTIVAYPSSSDEFVALSRILAVLGTPFASAPRPFTDQAAWLEALVEWVGKREDLQLVIRWHPRMGVSRNAATRASEYAFFREKFAVHPPNVVMIWPEDKISSYDLAEVCDVATVSWSTIGLELARLGVPVVATVPDVGTYPVGSFIGFASTSEGYFRALEHAMANPPGLSSAIEAIRWTYYLFWGLLVDVSDVVPHASQHAVPKWKAPKNSELIRRVMIAGEDATTINMDNLPSGKDAQRAEQEIVGSTLKKAAGYFLLGDLSRIGELHSLEARTGGYVSANLGGQQITRYSPLAARIIRILSA